MKKELKDIMQDILLRTKDILDKNINILGFEKNYYLINENNLYNINMEFIAVERKMKLNHNFETPETIQNKSFQIIKNLIDNYTKKIEKIYYEHNKDNAFIITIDFLKIKNQDTFFMLNSNTLDNDQKVIHIIQDAGQIGISATELNKKTKAFLSKTERNNILQELIKDEIIYIEYDKSHGRKKKVYRY